MSLITRKTTPASPEALQEQLRAAQARHADAVAAANAELIAQHNSALSTVEDREQAIDEQVKLLNAERDGLGRVRATARNVVPTNSIKYASAKQDFSDKDGDVL